MERLPDYSSRNAHEIDYTIYGEEMQFVEIELDPQEAVIAESGSFMMMDDGIKMDTIFGDGSKKDKGILGKLLGAGKRILTGESLFMTAFYNDLVGKRSVSFASPYPGKIIPIDLTEFGGKFICQKDAFLCAAKGVSVGIEFSKRLGRGLFGGEGFIMQKLEGDGMVFVHAGGTMAERTLQAGEILRVDTGCIVGFTQSVDYDIEFVGGIKNSIFGGEGLFFAKLQGPGKVYIQSLPFSRLANRVIASAPRTGGKDRGEGSILGGLGDLIDGDNKF
ncbi:TIGR00266 family protein [uncultured Winogradskyella sp.]|uniref:TIGR00266 family protein n=1 Tax=uncultured Winogradskyella sp. TaxID=395353 RepID=UPI003511C7F8